MMHPAPAGRHAVASTLQTPLGELTGRDWYVGWAIAVERVTATLSRARPDETNALVDDLKTLLRAPPSRAALWPGTAPEREIPRVVHALEGANKAVRTALYREQLAKAPTGCQVLADTLIPSNASKAAEIELVTRLIQIAGKTKMAVCNKSLGPYLYVTGKSTVRSVLAARDHALSTPLAQLAAELNERAARGKIW